MRESDWTWVDRVALRLLGWKRNRNGRWFNVMASSEYTYTTEQAIRISALDANDV